MYLILITILGLLFRLVNIIKPEGLWNDEYVSWMVAATPFKDGFFSEVLKQCHLPLYYFYLKPFAQCSDTILRLTSVLPSVIAIPVMYLVGKEYSEKTGKLCATITATLPFLIYYSQEVRFYSLLFLLSALTLLFFIKILKSGTKKEWISYSVSALAVLFTHVLGIIFIFFMTLYLLCKKKVFNKITALIVVAASLVLLPLGLNILKMSSYSQWWGFLSYTNIMFLFSDFFSPILSNNINAPQVFWYQKVLLFKILITLPTLIGITGLVLGFKKFKELIFISLGVIFIMICLALTGKVMFITKYLTEILPIFILVTATGFTNINKKWLSTLLISIFVGINTLSIITIYHPAYEFRKEGHRLPAVILNKENPDKIIYTYYAPDRFKRYIKIQPEQLHISKINRFEYLDSPQKILVGTKKGDKVSFVFLDSVSFIPENYLEAAKKRNMPEMFITFSSIRSDLEKAILKDFDSIRGEKAGSWTIISGIKK